MLRNNGYSTGNGLYNLHPDSEVNKLEFYGKETWSEIFVTELC